MKKSMLIALSISASIFYFSCKKQPVEPTATGHLKVELQVAINVLDLQSSFKSTSAEADSFLIHIYTTEDVLVQSYNYSIDMPDSIPLEVGSYYVTASYGSLGTVAFEAPFYFGQTDPFDINVAQSEIATVACSIQNCAVEIVYSDNIKSDFSSYSTLVSTTSGDLDFDETEVRYGYFPLVPILIDATLGYETTDGTSEKTLSGAIPTPVAGKLYQVILDASLSDGNVAIDISIDESMETEVINISEGSNPVENNWTGALIFSEIMYDPDALNDSEGEWVEFYNPGDSTVHLLGMTLSKDDVDHEITEDISIAAGEYLVLSRTETAVVGDDYVYGTSISLNNTGATLALASATGLPICEVTYGSGFPDVTGASIQLSALNLNVSDYINGSNWCVSTGTFDSGDFGTPGTANTSCE